MPLLSQIWMLVCMILIHFKINTHEVLFYSSIWTIHTIVNVSPPGDIPKIPQGHLVKESFSQTQNHGI